MHITFASLLKLIHIINVISLYSRVMDSAVSAKVQHVNKKSSDELLRKFAEMGSGSAKGPARKELRVSKRRKMSRAMEEGEQCESPSSLLERRSLLPLGATRRSALLRQLGIGRSRLSARDIKSRSFLGTIEKVSVLLIFLLKCSFFFFLSFLGLLYFESYTHTQWKFRRNAKELSSVDVTPFEPSLRVSSFLLLSNVLPMVNIVQTWHKTVEGASKVFMEKHYHRHKRLINYDIV